jgi:hypothetical protein
MLSPVTTSEVFSVTLDQESVIQAVRVCVCVCVCARARAAARAEGKTSLLKKQALVKTGRMLLVSCSNS